MSTSNSQTMKDEWIEVSVRLRSGMVYWPDKPAGLDRADALHGARRCRQRLEALDGISHRDARGWSSPLHSGGRRSRRDAPHRRDGACAGDRDSRPRVGQARRSGSILDSTRRANSIQYRKLGPRLAGGWFYRGLRLCLTGGGVAPRGSRIPNRRHRLPIGRRLPQGRSRDAPSAPRGRDLGRRGPRSLAGRAG